MPLGNSVFAQQGAGQLEEVIVTATKRGGVGVQDIPLSVQAISGDTLEEQGAIDFDDYFRQVPGLSVQDSGPGDKRYVVRGIASPGAGTVGLYLGEVILTGEGDRLFGKQPDPKMFDIDRVEVLKGPQGTTFGSSSLSGTIRWIPNAPLYDQTQVEFGAGIHTVKHSDDLGSQFDGMVNIPIVKDKVALRIAGLYSDKVGYLDNRFEDDANSEKTEAIRATLSWLLTDELEFSTMWMMQDVNVGARSFFNTEQANLPLSETLNGQPLPGEWYQASLTRAGHDEDMELFNATLNWEKSWGTVTGTYSIYDRFTDTKRSTAAASEILFGLPADQYPGNLGLAKDQEVSTAEIRYASNWEGPFQILVGGFSQKEERLGNTTYEFVDPITGEFIDTDQLGAWNQNAEEIDEVALFGEVSWDITDRFTATLGTRWFDIDVDKQTAVFIQYIFRPGGGYAQPLAFGFSDTIFRGNLAYELSDTSLLYLQVAEGYRAGGANDEGPEAITDVDIPAGYDSDQLINYELGFKSEFLDGRLLLNAAVYYIDWSNIQVELRAQNSQGLSFGYTGNAGAAEVPGLELELAAYPVEGLRIGATFNYMDAQLTEDMPFPQTAKKGDPIPYSPKTTASTNFHYERPDVVGGLTGFVSGDWSYVDEVVNDLSTTLRPISTLKVLEAYDILNLRAGVQREDWSLIFSVDNVLDADETMQIATDFAAGGLPLGIRTFPENWVRPWPRTFSIMYRMNFDL